MARNILVRLGAPFLLLAAVMLAQTARDGSAQVVVTPALSSPIPVGAAERLAGSLRIATISAEDPAAFDADAFQALHAYLQASFPRVHSHLQRETVNEHSLLYRWQGSNSSLKPILLIGHLDVVPVEPGTEDKWQHDPFAGRIADGLIWGRGAIDNKSAVVGMLEAIEMLLAEGFRPARTRCLRDWRDRHANSLTESAPSCRSFSGRCSPTCG